jgi:hypothetical protein
MKHTRNLINALVVSAITLAFVHSAAADPDGRATVIHKKGPARFTTGGGIWQPLEVGTVLKPGSVVQTSTERGSYVDLVLGEGAAPVPIPAMYQPYIPSSFSTSSYYQPSSEQNVIRVWENSALGIDKLNSMQTGAETVTDTQLDLKAGRVTGSVKKMSAASKYEIKLPNGVAGIRGTVFDVSAEGVMKILVGSGVMAWVNPTTGALTTQVVNGGQSYDARTGQLSPLTPAEAKALSAVASALKVVQPVHHITLAPDRTITEVSPYHGPVYNPSVPPTIIPPGHGKGSPPGGD